MAERTGPRLSRGDLVGVVSSGFAVRRRALLAGVSQLERWGYRVRLGPHVLAREGYLAGSDDARAADLAAMLADREVRAIWFARGGYGTARILDRLPWHKLRAGGKLLIGYSDLTALFGSAARGSTRCLYGPVVSELGDAAAYHRPSLRDALGARPVVWRFRKRDVHFPGRARGTIVGGNLSVLTSVIGTPFAPRSAGAILFLEEVGEPTYRLDRMLTQLRSAGFLDGLRGAVLGHFAVPPRRRFPPDRDWRAVLGESFGALGVPVVGGFPAGHRAGKWTLPLGRPAELDTAAGVLRVGP